MVAPPFDKPLPFVIVNIFVFPSVLEDSETVELLGLALDVRTVVPERADELLVTINGPFTFV
jgi:hypothetical protein